MNALAGGVVLASIAGALFGPVWLLLLGPLVFGVPHVASDLRYLLLQPPRPLGARLVPALVAIFSAMTLLRCVMLAGGPSAPRLELALGALAVGVGAWPRTGLVIGAVAFLLPAFARPDLAALWIGHLHNFVAVAVWWAWSERHPGRWGVLALLAAGIGVLLSGVGEPWLWRSGALDPAAGLRLGDVVSVLAPGVPSPWDVRLVLVFALMQAVHYGLWIACIPAIRGFAGWRGALGTAGVTAVVLGAVALPLTGLAFPTAARSTYLSLVLFHGWLELAVAAHLLGARAPR